MCRAGRKNADGKEVAGRRCPGDSAGSGGCDYVDERMRKAADPDAETQKFSQVHKEVMEEEKGKPKEELERAIGPQEFENFHKVVSKMINQSDMTDHDKMIARKKWNRAEEEVQQGQVSHVTLKTWEKMLAGTILYLADRIDAKGRKVQWRQISRALKASVSVREYAGPANEKVIPEGYESYEEFIQSLEDAEDNGKEPDFKDTQTLDENNTIDTSAEEINGEAKVFDGTEGSQQDKKAAPSDGKPGLGVPQSFARRPKSERGAHKAGKPVKEKTIFDEEPKTSEGTATREIPKVSVEPIHESKLSERLNAIQ